MLTKNLWSFFLVLTFLLGGTASCENDDSDLGDNKSPSNDINWEQDDTEYVPVSSDSFLDTVDTGPQPGDTAADSQNSGDPQDSDLDTVNTGDAPKDTGSNSSFDTGSEEPEPTDNEPQDTGPAPEPTILDSSHPGWQNPGCWQANCHGKKQTHNAQMKPNNCAKCHGKNGATKRQPPHFPCVGCHSPIKNHNPVSDFSNLATCPACHG